MVPFRDFWEKLVPIWSLFWVFGPFSRKSVMKKKPISVETDLLAAEALSIMNSKKITSLCVHKGKKRNKTIGIIHIHSILRANIS